MQLITSVDWYQYMCTLNTESIVGNSNFQLQKKEYGTRMFKEVHEVSYNGEPFAVIAAFPRLTHMDALSAQIKVLNNWLTVDSCYDLIQQMNNELGFRFKSLSRVDLAVDFKRFKGGKSVEKFISQFDAGLVRKLGKGNVSNYSKYSARGIRHETLKFGSETSRISYKLYNKSKEMDAVKMKPYIIDYWKLNGIENSGIHLNGQKQGQDVWRLEFSVKSRNEEVFDMNTGEIMPFQLLNYFDVSVRENYLQALLDKYWQFVKKPKKRVSKYSRLSRIEFFTFNPTAYYFQKGDVTKDVTRSEKILANYILKTVNDDLRSKNYFDVGQPLYTANLLDDIMKRRLEKNNLVSWAIKKGIYPNQGVEAPPELLVSLPYPKQLKSVDYQDYKTQLQKNKATHAKTDIVVFEIQGQTLPISNTGSGSVERQSVITFCDEYPF